jgi:hypothetical protein
MSGQAKRSRWRYLTRRRGALARLLARDPRMPRISAGGDIGHGFAASILDGSAHFGVHAARELARRLIALEDEQAVLEDWTRARGLGPENREPGAFGVLGWECNVCGLQQPDSYDEGCDRCGANNSALGWSGLRGGWPGKLAREYADAMTYECCGSWRREVFVHDPGPCDECKDRHARLRRAPMGRTMAKLGRDLLEALEGQPSECQADECSEGLLPYDGEGEFCGFGPCPDCHGTGHNLRGVLPRVPVTPQLRNRYQDAIFGDDADSRSSWLNEFAQAEVAAGCFEHLRPVGPYRRVVPRGEHRRDPALQPPTVGYEHDVARAIALLPRWRRGELRHAAQRRDRAWASITEGRELDRAIDAEATG